MSRHYTEGRNSLFIISDSVSGFFEHVSSLSLRYSSASAAGDIGLSAGRSLWEIFPLNGSSNSGRSFIRECTTQGLFICAFQEAEMLFYSRSSSRSRIELLSSRFLERL